MNCADARTHPEADGQAEAKLRPPAKVLIIYLTPIIVSNQEVVVPSDTDTLSLYLELKTSVASSEAEYFEKLDLRPRRQICRPAPPVPSKAPYISHAI